MSELGFDFARSRRITRAAEFRRAFQRRCSAADDRLLVYSCENGLDCARLGLVVSRKFGPAVARNRWKRLLREAFRLQQAKLPRLDLVVLPLGPGEVPWEELIDALPRLAARAQARLQRKPPRTAPDPARNRPS